MYFMQVVVYTGLMLLVYMLLLRDRPLHRFNRGYLLAIAVLPLILPVLKLPEALSPQASGRMLSVVLPEFVVGAGSRNSETSITFLLAAVIVLYIIGALALAVLKIRQYIQLRRLIAGSEKEYCDNYVLLKDTGYGPGSWGRYILLPGSHAVDAIIRHEQQHIELHHSKDMVFINLVQCLAWCNPFIHMVKKELVQVHEFQADAAAVFEHDDYSKLLLATVFGACTLPLTHSFINHPIKRRIMMLQKNRTRAGKRGLVAAAVVVAMAGGIVVLQSCQQKKEDHVAAAVGEQPGETGALMYVHKMPEPSYNLSEALAANIVYPNEAKEKGIDGKVIIKFIVDENGHIANIKPAKDDYNPLLADAAAKAIAALPDWTPGEDDKGRRVKVWFTLPVNFKLDKTNVAKRAAEMSRSGKTADEIERMLESEGHITKTDKNRDASLPTAVVDANRLTVYANTNVIVQDNGEVQYHPTRWSASIDENGKEIYTWPPEDVSNQ